MKTPQRQVVAEITPTLGMAGHPKGPRFDGYFSQVSGGEVRANVQKVYDGGAPFPDTICAPAEISDVTVIRHYDPARDGEAIKLVRQGVGSTYYDIVIYDLDCDLVVYGTERVYPRALLVGLSEPQGDAASGNAATFGMVFSISTVSGQTSASR